MRAMHGTEGKAYTMLLARRKLGYRFTIDGPLEGGRGEPSSFPQALSGNLDLVHRGFKTTPKARRVFQWRQ